MNNDEKIKNIIYKLIDVYNKNNEKIVNINNVYIGKIFEQDGVVGCIRGVDGWYLYGFYDHIEDYFVGPFNDNGIIKALVTHLGMDAIAKQLKFTKEEENIYLHNIISYDEFLNQKQIPSKRYD